MPRKKLNKKYRHTVRFDQQTEDCLKIKSGLKNMDVNQYIETLILKDCKE